MSENIIESAVRSGLRFQTKKGLVTTEDLWSIPLSELKPTAKELYKTVKEEGDFPSFLQSGKSSEDTNNSKKLKVIMYVISEREKEAAERRDAAESAEKEKARKEYILKLLEKKEMESLEGLSVEELKKLI